MYSYIEDIFMRWSFIRSKNNYFQTPSAKKINPYHALIFVLECSMLGPWNYDRSTFVILTPTPSGSEFRISGQNANFLSSPISCICVKFDSYNIKTRRSTKNRSKIFEKLNVTSRDRYFFILSERFITPASSRDS